MNDKKMISIDQFSEAERVTVEETYQVLLDKYCQRSGKTPDARKQKELTTEARQQVMLLKINKEKELAEKMKKKPIRRKKPESQKASEVSDFNWSASVAKGRRV